MTTHAETDRFVSPAQAAELVGVDRRAIYGAIRRGELRAVKVGPAKRAPVRVRVSDLAGWLRPAGGGR